VDDRERDELVEALIQRLKVEGAPAGTWLVDIAQARRVLSASYYQVDELLERLQDALLEQPGREPSDAP
jgi:hypothetical protein